MPNRVQDVADALSEILEQASPRLEAIGEAESLRRRGPGTWSRKQILGHLVDSAANNLHRFVRGQQGPELSFPDYDQPFWVERGAYQDRPWPALVGLWSALNLHLAHVIAHIGDDRLGTSCRIGGSEPLTLEFIVRDYVKHLRHHLDQILDPEASRGKAHPPFA
jgi:hypothetical protein